MNKTVVILPTARKKRNLSKIGYLILCILESLLVSRLVFKLLDANPKNFFVSIIYAITTAIIAPFTVLLRIIRDWFGANAVIELANVIGIIVYALIFCGIIKLIKMYLTYKAKKVKLLKNT